MKRFFFFIILALLSQIVTKAQTPYVLWCSSNSTLYFTYRSDSLSVGGSFFPENSNEVIIINALWKDEKVTSTGEQPGWYNSIRYCKAVVIEPSFQNVRPNRTSKWFYNGSNIRTITGLEYLNTDNVTMMNEMFYHCNLVTSLDVGNFNTENVTTMLSMFDNCFAVETLDVSHFNTSKCVYMHHMFQGCKALTEIDLSNFDTKNVQNMYCMFNDSYSLKHINLRNFDTSSLYYMYMMFNGCRSLTELDLSNFDTSKIKDMHGLFNGCSSLTSLDLSNFNTSAVTNMNEMFNNCESLYTIAVSNLWSTKKVSTSTKMFSNCVNLVGGKGTTYVDTHITHEYAHIDEEGNPGYLTSVDDLPIKLVLKASKTELAEGETFELTITAERASDTPTSLMLTCDNSVRFDFPSKLTLPAGETSVSTTVTVIDDHDIAETLSAAFTVSAEGYRHGEALVIVNDDDMPQIELFLAPTTVMSKAGTNAIMGTIKRSDNLNSKLTVVLSDDSDGLLSYSSKQVVLERGATEAHFTFGPNGTISADREANVTAAVYLKTCNCTAEAQSGGSITRRLTLLAGEGAAMTIEPLSTDFSLSSDNNGLVVTIESPTQQDVVVNVVSDFDDALDYEHAVRIPAGETSITVPVRRKDGVVIPEGQVITFTATSDGYATATCWMIATENSMPDAVITSFDTSATEAEAGSDVELTIVVKNLGSAQLGEDTPIKVMLSDGSYPLVLRTGETLSSGESTTITTSYQLPLLIGEFSFQAIVNPAGKIQEAVTSNNLSQEIPITIKPSYQVTAQTDKNKYGQGEVITVTGKATGTKSAFADVEVYFINDDMRQTVTTKTDAEGNYTAVFLPLDGTSGHFIIGACFPGENKTDAMAEVDTYGLTMGDHHTTCQLGQGQTFQGNITISNPGQLSQTDIRLEQQDTPVGCEFAFPVISKIEAGETIEIPYTITAGTDDLTSSMKRMNLLIKSNEGALTEHTIDYSIEPAKGCLKTDSTSIDMNITLGSAREFPITIWNEGLAPTGTISLTLPSWIESVTPQQLPSMATGDSVTVILRIIPNDKMSLNIPKTGRIGMNCADGAGLSISLKVTPVSDQTGTVTIDVIDEFTYCTEEKPHVSGAKVQVVNRSTQAIVAEGMTDAEGKFAANIPEGWYRLKVTADYHEAYDEYLLVDPGKDKTRRVFLSFNGINVDWKVEETEVEDEYSIETVLKFESQVPPPYIEVRWPKEKPQIGKYFPVTLLNKGLIDFFDVKTKLRVRSSKYDVEFIGNSETDTLAAGQAVIFHAKLTAKNSSSNAKRVLRATEEEETPASSSNECLEFISDTEAKCECYVIQDKNFEYRRGYGNCKEKPSTPGNSSPGGGGGGGGNDDDEEDDEENPGEPEEIACDLPKFKIITMNGNEKVLGVATDGTSQVRIVLDGDYDEEHNNRINWGNWDIDGNTDYGEIEYIDKEYHNPLKGLKYTAPSYFPGDKEAVYKVQINLPYTLPGKQKPDNITVEVELIRVPVVMVHGINSSRHCWDSMIPYLSNHGYHNYLLYAVDYSDTPNDSFEENKDILYEGLSHFLTSPSWNQHVINKVDVLAHSMGGLLTKLFIQSYPSEKKHFNRFITINTPHGGSQLGNLANDRKVHFVRDIQSEKAPHSFWRKKLRELLIDFSASHGRGVDGGALFDLRVGSEAIAYINNNSTNGIQCHAIVTSTDLGSTWESRFAKWIVDFVCIPKTLGYNKIESFIYHLYNKDMNDFAVACNSQYGGIKDASTYKPGGISFCHVMSCSNQVIQDRVIELLSSRNNSLFANGFGNTENLTYDKDNLITWKGLLDIYKKDDIDNWNDLKKKYGNDIASEMGTEWESTLSSISLPTSRAKARHIDTNYLTLAYSIADDTLLNVKISSVGELSNISFGSFYDDKIIAMVDADKGTIKLPDKIQGNIVVMYEGQCADGSWCSMSDTIAVNTIGHTTMQKLSFNQDSLLIINDEYLSPRVLCTWSDGVVTEVENPTLSVTNGNLAYIEDNKYVYGKNTGHTNLVATYGNLSCSTPLEVYITDNAGDAEEDDGNNDSSNSVCSLTEMKLEHKSVMTRQAFRGTLTITNNHPSLSLQNLRLHVEVRDEDGKLATQHEFQINPESLNGDFTGELDFDSGWDLKSGGTGVATILFIPTKNAAPTEPKRWSFGGTISYTDPFTGLVVTHSMKPVTLTVNPTPVLDFAYFMQRDAIGDDPMTTDITEATIPVEFALLINNKGNADAKNLKFVCKKPEVENDQGLPTSFTLLSTQMNGENKALTLSDDIPLEVGTVPAKSQTYLQWWLQSSWLGHFTEYDVTFDHKTSYGNKELSLIDQVSIHELIRGFTPLSTLDSQPSTISRAFLVNDIEDSKDMPDRIYFTNATQQAVTLAANATVSQQNGTYLLSVTPSQQGWTYVLIDNPISGNAQVTQITRQSDNVDIPVDNLWLTDRTLRDGEIARIEKKLHFIGDVPESGETYIISFDYKPEKELEVETYEGVPAEDEELEGPLTEVTIHFNKPINEETFTLDDLTLFHEGTTVDLSAVTISKVDAKTFKLNLKPVTSQNGYYVLMVNTQDIEDGEGFEGTSSREASWIQIVNEGNPEDYIKGDVDGDGVVDLADAMLVVSYYLGKPVPKFVMKAADVDGDGQIDLADAVKIISFYVGKISSL